MTKTAFFRGSYLLLALIAIGTISTLNYSNDQTDNVFIWILALFVLAIKKRLSGKELSNRSAIIVFLITAVMFFAIIRDTSDLLRINSIMIFCIVVVFLIIALEIYNLQNIVFGTLFGPLLLIAIISIILGFALAGFNVVNLIVMFLFFIYGNLTLHYKEQQE